MSNKRKNRNNKKVLKALRQKRVNGGRLNRRNGGPSDEDIQRMIAEQAEQAQQQPAQPTTTQPSGDAGGSVTVGVAPTQSIVPGDNPLENKTGKQSVPPRDTGDVVVTNPTTTTTTTSTTSTNDPKPTPPKRPGGMGQSSRSYKEKVKQYEADLEAWKARQATTQGASGGTSDTDGGTDGANTDTDDY